MKRNWKLMGAAIMLALALLAGCENAESLGKKGDEQAAAGNYVQAVEFYDKAIQKKPSAQLYLNRSVAYTAQNNSSAALDDLNAALNLDSSFVDAYNARAAIYLNQENYDSARSDYDQVLNLEPDNQNAKQGIAAIEEIEDRAATDALKNTIWSGILIVNGIRMGNDDSFFRAVLQFGEDTYKILLQVVGTYYGPSFGSLSNGSELIFNEQTTSEGHFEVKRNKLNLDGEEGPEIAGDVIHLFVEGTGVELHKQ